MDRTQALARLRVLLSDFPSLVRLLYRLLKDSRVSPWDKTILAGIVVYVLNPMDLMPDTIPVIGQIDDIYLLALGLLRLLHRTDQDVLREHWDGKAEVVPLLGEIVQLATFYLPEKVRSILLGRLEKPFSAEKS